MKNLNPTGNLSFVVVVVVLSLDSYVRGVVVEYYTGAHDRFDLLFSALSSNPAFLSPGCLRDDTVTMD